MKNTLMVQRDKNLKSFIGQVVEEKLKEFLGDPDEGKELRGSIKKRLEKSFRVEEKGDKGIAAKAFAEKFGLDW